MHFYIYVPLILCREGAHFSKEDSKVTELDASHPGTLELVRSWLARYGAVFFHLDDARR